MALLSFGNHPSGLVPNRGEFWIQIPKKQKTRTCREPRINPIKVDEKLYMYWKVRLQRDRKPVHFLGTATCTKMETMLYAQFYNDKEFADSEGFDSVEEMMKWFGPLNLCVFDVYHVISWGDTFEPSEELLKVLDNE